MLDVRKNKTLMWRALDLNNSRLRHCNMLRHLILLIENSISIEIIDFFGSSKSVN